MSGGRKINVGRTYNITFTGELSDEQKEVLSAWGIKFEAAAEKPEQLPDWNIKKYEPSLEELLNTMPMRHIENVKKCFEACKSKSDIAKVIKATPAYLGTFWAEYDGTYFTIVNRFFDDDIGDYYEEEYWYDYPEDWKDDNED